MTTKRLILLRSLPGGGKSTLAQALSKDSDNLVILSTDNYHMREIDGEWKYVFQPDMLGEYHKQNQKACSYEMSCGTPLIIIDNTNISFKEFKPYVVMANLFGYEVELVEPDTPWAFDVDECTKRNVHGVPREAIQRMLDRWESTEDCCIKIAQLNTIVRDFK